MNLDSNPATSPMIQPRSASREWNDAGQITSVALAAADAHASVLEKKEAKEETKNPYTSIKAGSVAQIVVAVIAVVGLIYLLKVVLLTTLTAMLLAFAMEPMVKQL